MSTKELQYAAIDAYTEFIQGNRIPLAVLSSDLTPRQVYEACEGINDYFPGRFTRPADILNLLELLTRASA